MTALPDPAAEPTISVEVGGALCGLRRSKSYLEARRYIDTNGAEGLPAIAFGRTLRCPTALVLRKLGLDAHMTNGDAVNGNTPDATNGAPRRE
jgi:hypothetical protein